MRPAALVGVILIVLGDVGPIHATADEKKTIPLPPILGGLALVGGVILLATGRKSA